MNPDFVATNLYAMNAIFLITLAAIWGGSFLFMKIGSPEFGPIAFMFLRTAIAFIVLFPLLTIKKSSHLLIKHWRRFLVVGFFNTALPFVLFAYAVLSLSAGMTSILNATTPMFGALIGFFWLKDKLTIRSIVGLIIGFSGVIILVLGRDVPVSFAAFSPVIAVLVATACYGLAANYTKQYFTGIDSTTMATGSQLAATIILAPLAALFIPDSMPSTNAWLAGLALGVVCTGLAYVLFFKLIANLGPTNAVSVTYLIPVFGVFWGALFLGEEITPTILIGGGVILLGVALATDVFSAIAKKAKNKKAKQNRLA